MSINIAIDGPAGAGKSTIAKKLAKELGFVYGTCCQSRSLISDMSELLRNNTVGGDLTAYSEMMSEGVVSARERMAAMAADLGADCIYGVQIATPEIAGGAAELVMFGTACRRRV